MKPILYDSTETKFEDNGIGKLSDAISCYVTEELNGEFFLEMVYPVDGIHFPEIKSRSIILAKPNPVSENQPFRVYRITKPMNRKVRVYAYHIRQDLDGIPVSPFSASSAADAMNKLSVKSVVPSLFTFGTDKATAAIMTVKTPTDIKYLLYGNRGGILDVYGGEYEFDRFNVFLHAHRGEDRGVTIRYGKNLTDMTQEENCANVFTGVYPYYADIDGNVTELPEKIISAPGTYDFEKYKMLDLSSEWQYAPTETQLRDRAVRYMEENKIGIPTVSIKLSFVSLDQTEEYKDMALQERVLLGDTVSVEFVKMGVSTTAKIRSTVFNVLIDRYDNVSIGDSRSSIVDTINNQTLEIAQKPSYAEVSRDVASKLAAAMGVNGGAIRFIDTNNDGEPDELYIADNPDPAQALKVWRFNYLGWAASRNGYNGPYELGATLEDGLLADFVTAAKLVAGTIQSKDGNFFVDLDAGVVDIKGQSVTIDTPNLKVSSANGVTATGSFTAIKGDNSSTFASGGLSFKKNNEEVATINVTDQVNSKPVLNMNMLLNGIVFGVGYTPRFVVNNGLNYNSRGEKIWIDNAYLNDYMIINGDLIYGTETENSGTIKGMGSWDAGIRIFDRLSTNGDLHVGASFDANGSKSRVVETKNYGRRALFCMEAANAIFSDMGSVTLDENGYSEIWLDPVFLETVDMNHDYLAFSSAGNVEKHKEYFSVKGDPGACVDWIVYYMQKDYTTSRLDIRPTEDPVISPMDLRIDNSVFESEESAVAQSEALMDEFDSAYEQQAESYLKNYEQEIYGYDY